MSELPVPDPFAEYTPLLWLLALALATLGCHAAVGYVRAGLRSRVPRQQWVLRGAAATALGSGCWGAMVLGISAHEVPFAVGYRGLGLAVAWAWAVAGGALAVLLLSRWPRPAGVAAAAGVSAGVLLGLQWLGVRSLGLQPGGWPRTDALALAAPLALVGMGAAFGLALLGAARRGAHRRAWRWAAALLGALGIVAAQALVLEAAAFDAQASSAYAGQVPQVAAALLAAIGVPLLLLAAELDLGLRQAIGERDGTPLRKRRRLRQGRVI